MKKPLCFAFLLTLCFTLAAQNTEGFEEWEYVGEWEVPVGWEVNNTFEVYPCSVKEEEAFSGQYALRLRSYGPSFEGYASGLAMRKFFITPDEALLALEVKADSLLPGGFAAIRVYSKADNYSTPIGNWQSEELTDDYEHLELQLETGSLPDSVLVVIESGTTLGPLGYEGYAEMVVDQLAFVRNVSAQEATIRNRAARIFPMPVREQATVELLEWVGAQEIQLELWDVHGRLVLLARGQAPAFTFERNGLPGGLYAYRLWAGGEIVQVGRMVML